MYNLITNREMYIIIFALQDGNRAIVQSILLHLHSIREQRNQYGVGEDDPA